MSYVIEEENFSHILRLHNTNLDGTRKVPYALVQIKGVGRRFAILVCKKAGININRRAGELSKDEIQKVLDIIESPTKFGIPKYFLNRVNDYTTGKDMHIIAGEIRIKLREDIERLKRARAHRGVRHHWAVKVRGQRTCQNGRGQKKDRLAAFSSFA